MQQGCDAQSACAVSNDQASSVEDEHKLETNTLLSLGGGGQAFGDDTEEDALQDFREGMAAWLGVSADEIEVRTCVTLQVLR